MRLNLLSLLVAVSLAATACGNDNAEGGESADIDPSPSSESTTPAESAPSTTASTPPPSKAPVACEPADALGRAIATGREDGTGLKFQDAVAVRSKDFEKLWFVAMEFTAPGVGTEVGVWASNSLKPGGGLIMSVDGFATEFTVWPDGGETSANLSINDDGASEALDCLA